VALTSVLVPPLIYGIDRWHLGYFITLIFFCRSVILVFGFPFIRLPNGWGAYLCSTIMISCSGVANVACETYFTKMIPSKISGSMRGVFNMFGQLGTLFLTIIAGHLYDRVSPASPFIVVGVLDFLLTVLTFSLSVTNKLHMPSRKL